MEINGLPLHPLVVHVAVVFGPLAALAALLYVGMPRRRDQLRWPMVALVVIATGAIWAAYLTGVSFRDSKDFFTQGQIGERVRRHANLAAKLRVSTSAFAVIAVLAAWLHPRTGVLHIAVGVLLAVAAVVTVVLTVLTGEAGARAVWG